MEENNNSRAPQQPSVTTNQPVPQARTETAYQPSQVATSNVTTAEKKKFLSLSADAGSVLIVALLVFSFLVPGMGFITLILLLFFVFKGATSKTERVRVGDNADGTVTYIERKRTPIEVLFRVVGTIVVTIAVGYVAFWALLIVLLTRTDAQS